MEADILFVGLQYVVVLLSCFFIAFVASQKKSALCNHLLMYSIGVLTNALAYTYELHSDMVEEALMVIRFEYIGLCTATVAAVLFICELFQVKLPFAIKGSMVGAFICSCLIITTNEHHHMFYAEAILEQREYMAVFRMVPGALYVVHAVITLFSMGICISVIFFAWVKDEKRRENYKKYAFLGVAAVVPLVFWIMRMLGILRAYDFIPFGLFCTNACFVLIVYFFRFFDVAENAKNDVLETLEEGILVCNDDGHILYENKRMHEIMYHKKINTLSDVMCEMIPGDEGEFLVGDRYYAVTESEVYEGKRVKGKTWCFIDMTATKERENQLRELHQEALAANKAKSNFLANMSHEIRTPINTILGMDELIIREAVNINVIEYAQNIKSEGRTLMSLINDLLDFAKIESGKMELVEVEYKFSAFVHDIVSMFSLKAEEKGLEFKVEVADDIPTMLYGDEIRFKQILSNLLTNAVKYTERGSVGLKIDWTPLGEKTALLLVTVRDSGIGMREEDMDSLFDKYKRLDTKRNNKIEGVGLGMNIAAELLQLMDGEITVESSYGVGSEFKVSIPQGIVDAAPMGCYSYAKQAVGGQATRETFTAPKGKVLVVDDNMMNRVVVKGLLKQTLLQIEEAASGEECLMKTMHTRYDIILMDHMMPGMDGVETLQRLRKQEGASQNVPVIVLTANAVVGVRELYLEQGFDDYMSKPVSGRVLEEMLLKYLPEELTTKREMKKSINVINAKQEGFQPEEIRNVLAVERIDLKGSLERMNGQKEMYRHSARVFASVCEERLRMLHEYIRSEDVPAYVILINAVKNDAMKLGAIDLERIAGEQEKMGKEGNLAFLRDKFSLLSLEYQRVAQCYRTLFDISKEERG